MMQKINFKNNCITKMTINSLETKTNLPLTNIIILQKYLSNQLEILDKALLIIK